MRGLTNRDEPGSIKENSVLISLTSRKEECSRRSRAESDHGWPRGIRIGSGRDGSVATLIPDPEYNPNNPGETGAHGLAEDEAATCTAQKSER